MKKIILSFSFYLCTQFVVAQNCETCRYTTPVFDSVTIETVKFGEGLDKDGNLQELYMDVYQPYGDLNTNRPVMIFAFGGGFVQGSKNDSYVELVCNYYARAGYVAVAIDYRIGINFATGILNPSGEAMRLFFRPMQDMRASIQYLNYSFSEDGNPYNIDTSKIFIGGASAGAITALMVAYCDKTSEFSELGNLSNISALGGFYSTSSLHPSYGYTNIAGVVNIAGALFNANWIEPGDVPIYSAHGDQDEIVPYSNNNPTTGYLSLLGITMEGSYLVDSVARAKGVCSYLYTLVGDDHPSASKPMSYYEVILIKGMSRFQAVVYDRSFCCILENNITPATELYIEEGEMVSLSATVSNASGNVDFLWCSFPCTDVYTSASFQSQPEIGSYYIFIGIDGSCQTTDFVSVLSAEEDTTNIGIAQLSNGGLRSVIYPNPSGNKLNFAVSETGDYDVFILNVAGQMVRQFSFYGNQYTLNAAELDSGMYVISISNGKHRGITRVMIE